MVWTFIAGVIVGMIATVLVIGLTNMGRDE